MIFNQYPYLNLNDLNLDYIMKAVKEMRYEVTNFVSINAIKYADPIQWNITSQYEKNTIVIDPVTGTAYISVAPVPAGVALTRTEYWTVVFDLGSFVTRAAQNFTSRWESDTTTTATFNTNAGEWLVWGDVLYKALVNITAGDTYVVGSNIDHFTIEDLYNAYLNTVASILGIIGDLVDLTTTDKTSIVNAINEVVSNVNDLNGRVNYVTPEDFGAVGDGVTDDAAALQSAITFCETNNRVLFAFRPKIYAISTALIVKNCYIDFHGAKILNNNAGYAIEVNPNAVTLAELVDTAANIQNLIIDCNGNSGINNAGIECYYRNITLNNIGSIGFRNRFGYETVVNKLWLIGKPETTNKGIVIDSSDSIFADITGVNCYTGVELNAECTFRNIHLWIGRSSMYNGSVFCQINAFNVCNMTQFDVDTYETAFKFANGVGYMLRLTNGRSQYLNTIVNNDSNSCFVYMTEPIGTLYRYLQTGLVTDVNIGQPTVGTFRICNLYSDNNLCPINFNNCRFNSLVNSWKDITAYADQTHGTIVNGGVKVLYGVGVFIDCIIQKTDTNNVLLELNLLDPITNQYGCSPVLSCNFDVACGATQWSPNAIIGVTAGSYSYGTILRVAATATTPTNGHYYEISKFIPFTPIS